MMGFPELYEDARDFGDAIHFLLPLIKDGENATQYRARCQTELGDLLYRMAILRKLMAK